MQPHHSRGAFRHGQHHCRISFEELPDPASPLLLHLCIVVRLLPQRVFPNPTTCDVCSHAPTTPPQWSTLRRSASSLSSIDHNHGSILRATSPYPRATGLEQKTQRESWRRHTSHGVACCDNLASGPEGSMGQYIWGSRHCCPENWTLQSFRLE